eukprot:3245286-Prymnesium_polylepis.1
MPRRRSTTPHSTPQAIRTVRMVRHARVPVVVLVVVLDIIIVVVPCERHHEPAACWGQDCAGSIICGERVRAASVERLGEVRQQARHHQHRRPAIGWQWLKVKAERGGLRAPTACQSVVRAEARRCGRRARESGEQGARDDRSRRARGDRGQREAEEEAAAARGEHEPVSEGRSHLLRREPLAAQRHQAQDARARLSPGGGPRLAAALDRELHVHIRRAEGEQVGERVGAFAAADGRDF